MNKVETISHFISTDEKKRKISFNKKLAKVINNMYKNQCTSLKLKT